MISLVPFGCMHIRILVFSLHILELCRIYFISCSQSDTMRYEIGSNKNRWLKPIAIIAFDRRYNDEKHNTLKCF